MPRLDAISQGQRHHMPQEQQQQGQIQQLQPAEPIIDEVSARLSSMAASAPARTRVTGAHEGERGTAWAPEGLRIAHAEQLHPPPSHPNSEESRVHSAARVLHHRGRTAPTNSSVVVCGVVAANRFHRGRERRRRSPSSPTSRALEELFNEEQIIEERRVAVQRVARLSAAPSSAHHRTVSMGEEDLFSNASTHSRRSIVEAEQRCTAATRRQRTVDELLPTASKASTVVGAVSNTYLTPLRVWLPRCVEALCALTCVGTPPSMSGVASGDRGQARLHTAPPRQQSSALLRTSGDGSADGTPHDYTGDGDDGFPVALWRRTPCTTLSRTGHSTADAEGAPTSLLSSPRWCVTAYEPLSLSLPATVQYANGDSHGPEAQQATLSTATFAQLSNLMSSNILHRSGAREDEDVVLDAEDEEAAAVSIFPAYRPPPAEMASTHSTACTASAMTRVYWGAAPLLRGTVWSVLRHRGATDVRADDDDGSAGGSGGAAFAGRRSAEQALGDRAQNFAVAPVDVFSSAVTTARPGQHPHGGTRGSDGVGARPSHRSATAAVHHHEPLCDMASSPSLVTCRRPPIAPGTNACVPASSIELRITLPWLLHTSTLPPVAAEALTRSLEAHIRAHFRPERVAQWKQGGACRSRLSGAGTRRPAAAHLQPKSSRHDDPPPCWVAVFAYTERTQMYATNYASCLVHAMEGTKGGDTSRHCLAGPRYSHCDVVSEAQLDMIRWPAWVPDAQTSVRMLSALTSGAFKLIEAIARALDQADAAVNCAAAARADMGTAEESDTEARRVRRATRHLGDALHSGGGGGGGGGPSRSSAKPCQDPTTVLHQFHLFFEGVFGDAVNKLLCRHVRDRLPVHVQDLSELLDRPWCGGARGDEDGDVGSITTSGATAGVWRAPCPSILDLVHHLARAWMEECFAGLAYRLHAFLITHDPGVMFDLIYARAHNSDDDDDVRHDDLCNCATLLKRMGAEARGHNACAQQHGCSAQSRAAAVSMLPPHALIYRGIEEFTHGPLQRWERWWLSSSSTHARHPVTTNTAASAAAMQWSTHVNYATVRSLQWVLRHPPDAHLLADGVQQSASNLAALTDMLALLELLTLMPPLLRTTALLVYEAEAVLRGACACVMGNTGKDGDWGTAITMSSAYSHNAITVDARATLSCPSTQGFHAYYRVFLGLVCYSAMQLSDAEGVALLSCQRTQPTGLEPCTAAPAHHDSVSALADLRSAQATVDSLWTRYFLPLVVGYVRGSGTAAAPAARTDALTAADQCITYALMLLQLLRLEGRRAPCRSRTWAQNAPVPKGALQSVPNAGVPSSRHRRKRARSAFLEGSGPQVWRSSHRVGVCCEDTHSRWWARSPTTANEYLATARSPRPESLSSSAFTSDTATTTATATAQRCVDSGPASTNEFDRVGVTVTGSPCTAAPAYGHAPRPGHRDEQREACNPARAGTVTGVVGVPQKEQPAPSPHCIPLLYLLAQGDAGDAAAAAATSECHRCPASPCDWRGVCRQLVRSWLQPKVDSHGRSCRESNFPDGTAQQQQANGSASARANNIPGCRPPLLDFCEEGGGHALHRRDVRRVGAFLVGLAMRVAAVREEQRGAHAESLHSDGATCCYDYLYGVLPPGLREGDSGLITVTSTSSADDIESSDTDDVREDAEMNDNLCRISVLRCATSTISSTSSSGRSSGSSGRNTLGTTQSVTSVSPLSSSLATSP
ncbi:hypothetical protein, conserved [Leishmania tarentolae]|uniref:Uncharacterized protein n=1 Tax=Leishmania tarentolae TaxID=5689 RepID=A0A640K8V1_LEITA|nr:hypothetical protein, conserved [Leishmania tarentolae]